MDEIKERLSEILSRIDRDNLLILMGIVLDKHMEGRKGTWEEFLKIEDPSYGHIVTSPWSRASSTSIAFLMTFEKKEDLKLLAKFLNPSRVSVLNFMQYFIQKIHVEKNSEMDLVHSTLTHDEYPFNYMVSYNPEDWIVTGIGSPLFTDRCTMISLCTDLVVCGDGREAPIRVFAFAVFNDYEVEKVLIDKYVTLDQPIVDYRTEITGITAEDLEGEETVSLADVQKILQMEISPQDVVIGHRLNKHFEALKMHHAQVIDTSLLSKYEDYDYDYSLHEKHPRPTLEQLTQKILWEELETGCENAARAVMRIVLRVIRDDIELVVSPAGGY